MRVRRVHALLCLLLAGCVRPPVPLAAASGKPVLLAVVSWNMHDAQGDLRRLVADLGSGRLTGTRNPPLVLLLQETTEPALREVSPAGAPGLSIVFAPVRRNGQQTTGNAVAATAPLIDRQVIDLPRERQPRAAAAATLAVAGERLFVVSAHLENRLGWLRGLFGDTARRHQADALLALLPATSHGILGGDMNTMFGPGEPALQAMLQRFDDTPRERLEPTFRDRLVLDHLFFDLPERWAATRRVLEDAYGSDHHPVLGIITADR